MASDSTITLLCLRAGLTALCLVLPVHSQASELAAPDWAQQLRSRGADRVNASLLAQPAHMAALNQRAADCEPAAVGLAVGLVRTTLPKAARLHEESLRVAVGTCTELVLAQLTSGEVPRICASASSWTITQTARELRRRIAQLDLDEAGRPSERGKACRAAYHHELHHTRVSLRVARPDRAGR
jgi:hypothetical protein